MKFIRKWWSIPFFIALGWFAGEGISSTVDYWVNVRPFNQCVEAHKPMCEVGGKKVYITYQ